MAFKYSSSFVISVLVSTRIIAQKLKIQVKWKSTCQNSEWVTTYAME